MPTSACKAFWLNTAPPWNRWLRVLPLANGGHGRTEMGISQYDPAAPGRPAWNIGKQVGVKKPLKQRQILGGALLSRPRRKDERSCAARSCHRQQAPRLRFGKYQNRNPRHGTRNRTRAMVVQQKTGRSVQFEITTEVHSHIYVPSDSGFSQAGAARRGRSRTARRRLRSTRIERAAMLSRSAIQRPAM